MAAGPRAGSSVRSRANPARCGGEGLSLSVGSVDHQSSDAAPEAGRRPGHAFHPMMPLSSTA
jgi:hypothetical protein